MKKKLKKKINNNKKKKLNVTFPEPSQKSPKKWQPLATILLIIAVVFTLNSFFGDSLKYNDKSVAVSELISGYNSGKYKEIIVDENKAYGLLKGETSGKQEREIAVIPTGSSVKDLSLNNVENETKVSVKDNTTAKFIAEVLPTLLMVILFGFIAYMVLSRMSGMAGNAMTFSKSKAKKDDGKDKVYFTDVAGAEEEKQELQEVVDFLKHPKKYKKMGAKIPRGILLVGPPGTGKTLIARAVAGESDVPFFSISGSEFVEMFVGVGASRVRDLFETAKKEGQAIIFIDEIDAIGKKRGPGMGGGHDEREQTLNQILTEMDGFTHDTNIIVMGATNRADVLDKALLRPGRFDRKVTINLPNLEDRIKILEVHARNKPIADDVDFRKVASSTVGFSGADLGNLMNEAAILSARHNKDEIVMSTVQEALERKVIGLTKKSQKRTEEENKIVAYHEVGHAVVGRMTEHADPVHKISIVGRGATGGVTWFLPEKETILTSKAKFKDELAGLYGGRVAEEIFFGEENITTGASNDIDRATAIARGMVTRYGMDDVLGAENFAPDHIEGNFLGYEGDRKVYSEKTQELIDQRVKIILKAAYDRAKDIITENKDLMVTISEDLLKKEEITGEEFENYFTKKA